MTVTYTAAVATSSIGCFLRLLFRWRGSIYKQLWKEVLIFLLGFYSLNFVYRFALNADGRKIFERITLYCHDFGQLIPLAFVLGFYVNLVATRWWLQFSKIPWPDKMALFVSAYIHGHDERGRLMRRTMMRYLELSFVLTMQSICPEVKRRFPTFTHMTQAGFMLPNEQKIIEDIPTTENKYFVPLAWATSLAIRTRTEQRIKYDFALNAIVTEINEFRNNLAGLFQYDWISVPLVYTQVVTLASYTFFLTCLMSRQPVASAKQQEMDVPIFTLLQFLFYMGWLKVAECMINPFGDDDDDFDVNALIDRNLKMSYLVVDEMHEEHPELIRDQYWDALEFDVPYTKASLPTNIEDVQNPFQGSTMDVETSLADQEIVILPKIPEAPEDEEKGGSKRNSMQSRKSSRRSSSQMTTTSNPDEEKGGSKRDSILSRKSSRRPSSQKTTTSSRKSSEVPEEIQMFDLDEDDPMNTPSVKSNKFSKTPKQKSIKKSSLTEESSSLKEESEIDNDIT